LAAAIESNGLSTFGAGEHGTNSHHQDSNQWVLDLARTAGIIQVSERLDPLSDQEDGLFT
jgi:hypothetical protein